MREESLTHIVAEARIGALEDAAADANFLSNDRSKGILFRVSMRVAAKWLHARVLDAREAQDHV